MTRIKNLSRLVPFALALPAFAAPAPAKGPRQELKELTSQLQASPSDQALREKIIALAVKLKPPPAVPEEAKRRMARGEAAFESAQTAEEVSAAASEFQIAANAAPWLASAYYNLGLAQEKAGRPAEAMKNLKLYLLTAPGARDAAEVEKKIYKLEFMEEKRKAAASDLSGKWGSEQSLRKGEYAIEIYQDAGSYRGRPQQENYTGTISGSRPLSYQGTRTIEDFAASSGRISFTVRQEEVYGAEAASIVGGNRLVIESIYRLSLSQDGKTLDGTIQNRIRGSLYDPLAITLRRMEE